MGMKLILYSYIDVIHDCSLEQFITSPTRGSNTLDLTFSSQSIISDTSIVPGMSDHEAVQVPSFHVFRGLVLPHGYKIFNGPSSLPSSQACH